MKLIDIVRRDPKMLKIDLKAAKRKKRDKKNPTLSTYMSGTGDNAIRGMHDDEGYIQ